MAAFPEKLRRDRERWGCASAKPPSRFRVSIPDVPGTRGRDTLAHVRDVELDLEAVPLASDVQLTHDPIESQLSGTPLSSRSPSQALERSKRPVTRRPSGDFARTRQLPLPSSSRGEPHARGSRCGFPRPPRRTPTPPGAGSPRWR